MASQHKLYKDNLYEAIDSAQDLEGLLPMLKRMPIHHVKQFMLQEVHNMSTSIAKEMQFNALSMDRTIPSVVIHYILSFQEWDLKDVRLVNKQWNKLSNQHEKNYYFQLNKKLNQNSPIPYNSAKNTSWILSKPIRPLTKIDKDLGFKMSPTGNVGLTIRHDCKSGDRLFLHNGIFKDNGWIDKDVSIIGVGGNGGQSVIKISTNDSNSCWSIVDYTEYRSFQIYIENVVFNFLKSRGATGAFVIGSKCKLSLNKCKLLSRIKGIVVNEDCCINVNHCIFDGAGTAIKIDMRTNQAIIRNNVFRKYGNECRYGRSEQYGCVQIYYERGKYESRMNRPQDDARSGKEKGFVELTCKGNVFEDNLCYLIAERAVYEPIGARNETVNVGLAEESLYIQHKDLYTLKYNILKGYNAAKCRKVDCVKKANMIYYNNE